RFSQWLALGFRFGSATRLSLLPNPVSATTPLWPIGSPMRFLSHPHRLSTMPLWLSLPSAWPYHDFHRPCFPNVSWRLLPALTAPSRQQVLLSSPEYLVRSCG